jgi:hypothetical protein
MLLNHEPTRDVAPAVKAADDLVGQIVMYGAAAWVVA